jgi:hypothetical protein
VRGGYISWKRKQRASGNGKRKWYVRRVVGSEKDSGSRKGKD